MNAFCLFFKSPSPAGNPAPSPSRGEGWLRPWCHKILGPVPRMTGARGAGFVRLLRSARNDAVTNGEGWHRPWCDKILGTGPSMTGGRGAGFVRLLRSARNDAERNNIAFKGLDVVRQYAALLKRRVQTGTRARKALVVTRQANPLGRSMIEMLGVLAIIGVLSVAGIAGYSKAMEKWKINKMSEEYSYLIHGLLGHLTEFQNLPVGTGLVDTSFALGIIPDTWKKDSSLNVIDTFGNLIKPYVRDNRLVIDFYLGGISTNSDNARVSQGFSKRTCETLMRDVAAPLHYSVSVVWIFLSDNPTTPSKYFYGDSHCSQGLHCLSEITLSDIHEACGLCDGKRQCSITLEF